MKFVEVIFVTPIHNSWQDKVGALVQVATGSKWAHVAGYLLGGVYEAIMPEVMISPADKYSDSTSIEVLSIAVTNKEYEAIEKKAKEFLGRDVKYGIADCIVGGIASLFGRKIAYPISKLLGTDRDNTLNCVGVYASLLLTTKGFGGYMNSMGWYENNVSWMVPQDLYTLIKSFREGK